MKEPTVWVVKEQLIRNPIGSEVMDYSPAQAYGDIQFITRTDLPLHARGEVQLQWDKDVAKFVQDYDDSRDLIIATGQPTAIFAIGHALGIVGKKPRFLVWRREESRYKVLDITPL